ncbi:MAG: T9SS type A sorting domain-containing protein [Bacteroidota bacterium]
MTIRILPLFLFLVLIPFLLPARVLEVGAGRTMTLPSQAAAAAQDGDTISIDAGEYVDACRWSAHNLLIRGIGGYAHVRDKCYGGKAIWVIQGNNTTVEWIEFSGATVPDKNGAGIRQEGTTLTIRRCFFHDNEDGILAGDNSQSRILIEYSEFARCGYGDGFSHNMYINHIAEFTIRYSYIHHAKVGHNIKSRALRTFILCNGITSGDDGNPSREIDLPNGGLAVIAGNVIVHGVNTQNSNLIGYGQEGLTNPVHNLYVVHNTFSTARSAGTFVSFSGSGIDTVVVKNNLFAGRASMLGGSAVMLDTAANLYSTDIATFRLSDPAAFDYRPLFDSPAIDRAVDAGSLEGTPLLPVMEYAHPAGSRSRTLALLPDIGALEFLPPVSVSATTPPANFSLAGIWPNPATDAVTLSLEISQSAVLRVELYDINGKLMHGIGTVEMQSGVHAVNLWLSHIPRGWYICRVSDGRNAAARWLLLQ